MVGPTFIVAPGDPDSQDTILVPAQAISFFLRAFRLQKSLVDANLKNCNCIVFTYYLHLRDNFVINA